MQITTPRLIIRRPVIDDLNAIHSAKIAVWPELQKWMSWAFDSEDSLESTRAFIEDHNDNLCGFDRSTGDFVISSGIHKRPVVDEYATGYWVSANYLGRGFATESTNAILRYIFAELNAHAVHIDHYEGNANSENVIRKLGFKSVAVHSKTHKRCSNGEALDVHTYVMHGVKTLPELEVTWR